jgi:glycosyltransferase involved in cell wall biosynthesis
MKKILHFSTLDYGGAGSAAYRFHKNLQKSGFQSALLVNKKKHNDTSIIEIKGARLREWFFRLVHIFELVVGIFNREYYFLDKMRYAINDAKKLEAKLPYEPDIIVLHWISQFIDLEIIEEIRRKYKVKIYWYLMDMAPLTGGCHFSWDCKEYISECNNCPAVSFFYSKLPHKNLLYKKRFVSNNSVVALSATGWLESQLKESVVFNDQDIKKLMLSVNENTFENSNAYNLRDKYKIRQNKRIVFFGAASLKEKRKGFRYILDALALLSKERKDFIDRVVIVTAGNVMNQNEFSEIGFEHKHIGFLSSEQELAEAYQMADIFVSPSIEDSGPMMINESLMCGTPIVAFNMGVAGDLVITGKTGYLAELKSVIDLKNGILNILDLSVDDYNVMSNNCRELALLKVAEKRQIDDFTKIIREI